MSAMRSCVDAARCRDRDLPEVQIEALGSAEVTEEGAAMTDWISPEHRPPPRQSRGRGEEVWRMTRDGRVLSCELRDDSSVGAGIDVAIRENDELSFSRRCADEAGARYVAEGLRKDHIRA